MDLSAEAKKLLNLIEKKEKLVAMLAPSFVIDFGYPEIIRMLKKLGFSYVAEIARGAEETNKQLFTLMKLHPDKKFITSPCPNIVRLIKSKYPNLVQYLTKIDTPMSATAKMVIKKYPGYKIVHFSPCLVKKLEAKEDFPELNILALTYKDLSDIFKIKKIKPRRIFKTKDSFDITGGHTRLYPISGGLAQSAGVTQRLTDAEYDVVSGPALVNKALQNFEINSDIKLLDILNCDGGCINGPGMVSKELLDKRRKKVIDFWNKR